MNPTCSIILIGDELLSGRTEDANMHHIACEMAKIGVRLQEVRVIPDDEDEIIETLNTLRKKYTYVFTTGGIGPTHDDITAACVAKAFGVEIYRDESVVEQFQQRVDYKVREATLKMADFPVGSELIPNPLTTAPGFRMENVFVMAGIPKVMRIMLEEIIPQLETGDVIQSKHVDILAGESKISFHFEAIQNRYEKTVSLGSYPFRHEGEYCTSLVLRSDDAKLLIAAFNDVEAMLIDLKIEKHPKN
jgi:molybdenum cofactor synthesis domain-containing protein